MTKPDSASESTPYVRCLWLSSAAVFLHHLAVLSPSRVHGFHAAVFTAVLLLTQPLTFLLPVVLPLLLLRRLGPDRAWPFVAATLAFSAVHTFFFADQFLFSMYGFHVNGFVWNLLTTRGGIDSLGASDSTRLTVAAGLGILVALQAALIPLAKRLSFRVPRRAVVIAASALAVLLVAEKLDFGWSRFRFKTPILAAAESFPFYLRVDLSRPAQAMGFERRRPDTAFSAEEAGLRTRYPLAGLERRPGAPSPDILWLVSESWRADMLDPEIMPATWAFAQKSLHFRSHYSGGNGTRAGVFSMFYGLPGPYWFPFIEEQRGPALMDVVIDGGYDVRLFTSAAFTYPEFDRTVWRRVPGDRMYEATESLRWMRDRMTVERLVQRIRDIPPGRPAFTFMFFESPHAPYTFPPECAIRTPYLEDFNYVLADYQGDIALIRNRYVNACRHLDTQIDRVLRTLEETGRLDSTIVVLTGDHGEEFNEKGHWGHNSAFTEEQTRVPLVLHIPGQTPARIDRLTSHLDLPATILPLLGVETPAEAYGLGFDLRGPVSRDHVVVSDWNDVARVDAEAKISLSMKTYSFAPVVTTHADGKAAGEREILDDRRPALLRLLRDLGRFRQ